MIKPVYLNLILVYLLFFNHKFCVSQQNLLPDNSEIEDWKTTEVSQFFKGDALFTYIDGGADIFVEYGFNNLTVNTYFNSKNQSIQVEIYEMVSDSSAFGIFSLNKGTEGNVVEVGNESVLYDYYLTFWKNRYYVVLTGTGSDKETVDGIIKLARIIENKIKEKGKKPIMVKLFCCEDLKYNNLKYIRGNIGLSNLYSFNIGNNFNINECLVASYNNLDIYIFRYSDGKEAMIAYNKVKDAIFKESKYSNQLESGESFSVNDKNNKKLTFTRDKKYMIVQIGSDAEGGAFELIKKIIEKTEK